jgi:hypothetical protein
MQNNQLTTIIQNSKSALIKSKKSLDATKTILNNKNYIKYQFWIPATFTRVEEGAINSQKAIILYCENIFLERRALLCLIKRNCNLKNKILFILDSELLYKILKEKFADKEIIICKSKDIDNQDFLLFDEIVILYDLNLENLLDMKSKNRNISFFTNKKEYIDYFPDNEIFELDEVILPSFEIFDFARQFVPNNLRWNNKDFLNRLQQRNSGADKPFVYEVNSFEEEIEIINEIINECPVHNIVILLPFGKDENNFDLSVEKYYQILRKNNSLSRYYLGITVFKLSNIIVTTFDDIKYIDSDIVVIPQFNKIKEIVDNEKVFTSICSAKNQLHLL